mmetsp:Transcript_79025/g.154544  ORF Transcript_79025/g.154544 Transcript_79025/m.154544 type:complete len:312 (-) Transcript_79025:273-1208(-)
MSESPDYYDTLGVSRSATDAEIKRNYRKLAMKWHPDKNQSSPEASITFQNIGEAYDVLSDKQKKAIYDQYGYEALRDGIPDESGNVKGGYKYTQNAGEIFNQFFGTDNPFADFGFGQSVPFASRMQRSGPKKMDPIQKDLPCTLEELFNGCTKKLAVTRKRQQGEAGELVDETKHLVVSVKPGWKAGTKITFPCEGDEAPGTVPADLVFCVVERVHAKLVRDGHNLIFNTKLSLADALTDCSVEVPTLDGRMLSIPVPEVVAPGYERAIPEEGMPLSKKPGVRGDLIIRFSLVFPEYLSEDKKAQLRKLLL